MPHGDTVDEPGSPQGQQGHVQRALVLAGLHEIASPTPQHPMREFHRELVVARRHRGMRGEHALLPHLLDHLRRHIAVPRFCPDGCLDQCQDQQRRMPFVEVVTKDVPVPQRAQKSESAEPQDHFLA